MTVTSDLFLSMPNTAPAGGRSGNRSVGNHRVPDNSSPAPSAAPETSENTFKNHLAEETQKTASQNNNTAKTRPAPDQTATSEPSQSSQASPPPNQNNMGQNNVGQNDKDASTAKAPAADNNIIAAAQDGEAATADAALPQPAADQPRETAKTPSDKNLFTQRGHGGDDQPLTDPAPETQSASSAAQGDYYLSPEEAEKAFNFAGDGKPAQDGQDGQDTPEKPGQKQAVQSRQAATEVAANAESNLKTGSGMDQTGQPAVQTVEGDPVADEPIVTNNREPAPDRAITAETPDKAAEEPGAQPADSADTAPNPVAGEIPKGTKAATDDAAPGDLVKNAATRPSAQSAPEATPATASQATAPVTEPRITTPEQQSAQQAAAAATQPVRQTPAEADKSLKDADKKPTRVENAAAVAHRNNIKGPEQASSEGGASRNSTGGGQDTATAQQAQQPKAPAAGQPTDNRPLIAPFLSDAGQILAGGENKPLIVTNLPHTGLLSVQEVGQPGSATPHIKPALPPVTPQMVSNQISITLAKHAGTGQNSFRVSLQPAELGQVDIRMDFHADGKMHATVTVDNERTLNLLQRDQGALEKALENAGFDSGGNNLNFSLKKQQQGQPDARFAQTPSGEADNEMTNYMPDSIIGRQEMKVTYSDNVLDINI